MPFPIVWGIPENAQKEVVAKLRRDIVAAIAKKMDCEPAIVTPFFPKDWLGDPVEPEDGGKCIYVSLDTGMVHGKSGDDADQFAKELTGVVAQAVSNAFERRIEVECFIGDLNSKWKTLIRSVGCWT